MIDFKLHHIGCAVKDVCVAVEYYCTILGYSYVKETQEIEENTRAVMLEKDGIFLEVLQPINSDKNSPLDKILSTGGGGIYHDCYQVSNLEKAISYLQKSDFIPLRKKSTYWDTWKFVYMITPDNHLLELVEVNNGDA